MLISENYSRFTRIHEDEKNVVVTLFLGVFIKTPFNTRFEKKRVLVINFEPIF
jgi:hypothetical protein